MTRGCVKEMQDLVIKPRRCSRHSTVTHAEDHCRPRIHQQRHNRASFIAVEGYILSSYCWNNLLNITGTKKSRINLSHYVKKKKNFFFLGVTNIYTFRFIILTFGRCSLDVSDTTASIFVLSFKLGNENQHRKNNFNLREYKKYKKN